MSIEDSFQMKLSPGQEALFNSYMNRDLEVMQFPKYLVIETTNACNLKCIMCPRVDMTRKVGFMDFGLFKKIIDEAAGKAEFIYLHFFGEPLLNKDIFKFIDYACGKCMTIAFSTNATFLTKEISEDLLKSQLDFLIISMDSINKSTYDKIRINGDFETTIKNIENFLAKHEELKSTLNVSIQIIRMNQNETEIDEFTSKWDIRSGINVVVKGLHDYANQVKGINQLAAFNQPDIAGRVCADIWRGLVIGWDGVVVPCCNDFDYKNILGNIRVATLSDVWNSTEMKKLRQQQVDGKQKDNVLCRGCSIPIEDNLHGKSLYSVFNPERLELHSYFNSGLYDLEITPDRALLWTRKEFELLIQDKQKDIRLVIANANPHKETLQLSIKLFDKDTGKFDVHGVTEIVLATPQEYKGRLLRYHFELSDDFSYDELYHNHDKRRLGLIIIDIVNYGHTIPRSMYENFDLSLVGIQSRINPENLSIEVNIPLIPDSFHINEKKEVKVILKNKGTRVLSSFMPFPVFLSYHWKETDHDFLISEGIRSQLNKPLRPSEEKEFVMTVQAPAKAGKFELQITLVQENNYWFENHLRSLPLSFPIDVL